MPLPSRYRLMDALGRGGFGAVYRAHDTTLGRDVAIKLLEREPEGESLARQRMHREAQSAARLRNPHIVAVYDVDPEGRYIVMELVRGESLRDRLRREERLPADQVRAIADDLLDALGTAHAVGIVHRDLKPANVMQADDGRIVLVDFGVAHLENSEITASGARIGTPAYMAPEQFRGGQVDERTDLYALGATLFHLVVGRKAEGLGSLGPDDRAALEAVGDPRLARFIDRCVSEQRSDRYANAASARSALNAQAPTRWPRRAALAGLAVGLLSLLGWVATAALSQPESRLPEAWRLANHAQYEQARDVLAEHLARVADDPDGVTMKVLVEWWAGSDAAVDAATERALAADLSPAQRAMIRGIALIRKGRYAEGVTFLKAQARDHPNEPAILYALGESHWHGGDFEAGAEALEKAFLADATWQVALHHVEEFELSRGKSDVLERVATRLRSVDLPAAHRLNALAQTARGAYAQAAQDLEKALEVHPEAVALWRGLAQNRYLSGDIDEGEKAARKAFDLAPMDDRNEGGFTLWAEAALYRADEATFRKRLGRRAHPLDALVSLIWRRTAGRTLVLESNDRGFQGSPPYRAVQALQSLEAGKAPNPKFADPATPALAAFVRAAKAEYAGRTEEAAAGYRELLSAAYAGGLRLLTSYLLARLERGRGRAEAAAGACAEVIRPRRYDSYRAVVLRDCLKWRQ